MRGRRIVGESSFLRYRISVDGLGRPRSQAGGPGHTRQPNVSQLSKALDYLNASARYGQ